jgi:hypothetical protein
MAHSEKEVHVAPWTIKEGDLVTAWDFDREVWVECLGVEKTRGPVTGGRCWRILYVDPMDFSRRSRGHLVFPGEKVWVRRKLKDGAKAKPTCPCADIGGCPD